MASPKWRLRGGRGYHLPTGETVVGVTTMVGAMDPDAGGLVVWASNLAAEAALDTREEWDPLETKADALDLIKVRAKSRQTLQRNVGTATHEQIEHLTARAALGENEEAGTPAPLLPYVRSWLDWREEYAPRFTGTEVTVVNRALGYAGTLDALAEVPGVGRVLVDYKTGKSIRPKDWGQMLALAMADTVLHDDGTEEPFEPVDRLWLVQLRPGAWTIHEVPWGGQVHRDQAWDLIQGLQTVRGAVAALEGAVRVLRAPEAIQ